MTGRAVNGSPTSYTVNDLNEVTSIGGTPCTYDQNGNRITYGQGNGTTSYEYDDENRETCVITRNGSPLRSDFTYDGLGRLRVRAEYTWYYNQWSLASTTRYIYDGKRVIQERNGSNTPLVAYTRGKDLSGSLEGAGGIGGLLARSHGYSGGAWSTHNFYHADANGNITCMVDPGQNIVASYKYDPYGRTISSSGSLAAANLYRFSSKEFHANSGFYYYFYRFYDPSTQRWLNRDPLEEWAGLNIYRFLFNAPAEGIDPWGEQQTNKNTKCALLDEALWEGIATAMGAEAMTGLKAAECAVELNKMKPTLRDRNRVAFSPEDDIFIPDYGPTPPPVRMRPPPTRVPPIRVRVQPPARIPLPVPYPVPVCIEVPSG